MKHTFVVSQSFAEELWEVLKSHGVMRLMEDVRALIAMAKEAKP